MSIADIVEQQTSTTGTGTYTVSGTVPYRRTFLQAFPADATLVPYMVVDSSGNFESGLGSWAFATLQLARTVILTSSNANAAVSWAAGIKKIYCGSSSLLSGVIGLRNNMSGAVASPGATDDQTKGYAPGSLWQYTGVLYQCTSAGTGAATWQRLIGFTDSAAFPLIDLRTSYRDSNCNGTYFQSGFAYNGGKDTASFPGFYAVSDGAVGGHSAITANATPRKMGYMNDWTANGGIYCEGKSCVSVIGTVSALDKASGDIASWKVEGVLQTDGSGVVTVRHGAAPTLLYASAGASTWSIALIQTGIGYDAAIEVTGEAATDIIWSAALHLSSVAYF